MWWVVWRSFPSRQKTTLGPLEPESRHILGGNGAERILADGPSALRWLLDEVARVGW
jgi:hypothetical protein